MGSTLDDGGCGGGNGRSTAITNSLRIDWAALKEFKLTCHNSDTIVFTIYPYYGNLSSFTATQFIQDRRSTCGARFPMFTA